MKEIGLTTGNMGDRSRKYKKRRVGTNFTNSKQKRRRELKKREATQVGRQRIPTNFSEVVGEDYKSFSRLDCKMRSLVLEPIEEEVDKRGESRKSPICTIAKADQESDSGSNKSRFKKDTKADSLNTINLSILPH